jgi:hypothetical protein
MRSYLVCSLVIAMVATAGCGDGRPSTDARDTASDKNADGSPNDRIDANGSDRADSSGTGGSLGGNGGDTGGTGGATGVAGTGGSAGSGGGSAGNDGGAGTDGGNPDGAAPSCSDGIKNSDETGIDCGGHCGKCAPGGSCLVNADCQFSCRADKTCAACNVATDCTGIETECVHRACTAGVCDSVKDAAGTVLTVQTSGDCKKRQCAADGSVTNANDDTDVPEDHNPCTNDVCTSGTASHTMVPANSNCGGANHCNATGQCIGCTVAADCPGTDTACRTRTCTTGGVCGYSNVASGTKLVDPTAGDCKGLQCDGAGNQQVVNDNADLPVDNNVCTTDECTAGTPSHRPVTSGTTCGGSLVCDGASHCVECLSANTCPGTDADCHTRSCVSGACGVANIATGTLVAAQTPRDCKKNVCNGQGGVVTVNDDLDLPVDSNACTFDVCTAGTPSNPNVPSGNACGASTICDGQGACVTCLTASSCPGTDTECHHRTCTAGVCGTANTAAGTALSTQVAGDCKRNQCDGAGAPMIVNDDADKPVDGNACTDDVCTAGVPSNPNIAQGTTCGPSLMCNGQGSCVGCVTASNCGTDTFCQARTCSSAGVCGVNNTAAGTAVPSQTAGDCKKVQCDGQGQQVTVNDDTDRPVDGNACTQDLCNAGIASNPPEAAGTTCNMSNGSRCNGSGTAPACVQCLQPSDCPGTDNECHHRTCSAAGVCGVANTADGTLVQSQSAGDCKKNICMTGAQVTVNDDLDVPVDGNSCTMDVCTTGTPSNPSLPLNAACNENGGTRCNGSATAPACVVCTQASHCGTDSVCQSFSCSAAGTCVTNNVAQGTAIASQTAGDCKKNVCNGNGAVVAAADDADLPVDGNGCTSDLCSNGVASNPSLPANTACSENNGTRCNGSATAPACVQCLQPSHCGTDTDCQTFTCSGSGQCGTNNAAQGTATSSQAAGDCKKNVCNGNGASVSMNDNTDVPVDGNECTADVCTNGAATNPPLQAGTSCGTPGGATQMCDGAGACVGCLTEADCPLPSTACQVRVCGIGGVCGFTNVAQGTLVTNAPVGNCHRDECDGLGNVHTVIDNNDKPSTNGNTCVQAVCTAGTPSLEPLNAGTACSEGTGVKCDGMGACVECISATECTGGPDTDCHTRTCTDGACGLVNADVGTPTTNQTSGNCQTQVCDGMGGTMNATDNSDAPVSNNECTTGICSAGVPGSSNKAHGTSCTVGGLTCDGSGTCNTTFSVLRLNGTSSAATSITIEEHKLDGTLGITTDLPTAAGGGNLAIFESGSASSEGSLSLSGDGRYLIVAGYNSTSTQTSVASAAVPRIVARIDAASPANINSTTTIPSATAFTGNNLRGATSQDGTGFWLSGQGTNSTGTPPFNGGIWYVGLGGSNPGPTQITMPVSTQPTNTRWLQIFNGQLYATASNSPFFSVFSVGTGLPTTGGQTVTTFPGLPTATASPFSFVFFDRDASVTGYDLLYISDDGNSTFQGIQKWTFGTSVSCPSGCWTQAAKYNLSTPVDFKGLAGFISSDNNTVTLMATTDEGTTSRLVKIVEVFGASPSVTVTPLGSSPTGQIYRGVALSPHL